MPNQTITEILRVLVDRLPEDDPDKEELGRLCHSLTHPLPIREWCNGCITTGKKPWTLVGGEYYSKRGEGYAGGKLKTTITSDFTPQE